MSIKIKNFADFFTSLLVKLVLVCTLVCMSGCITEYEKGRVAFKKNDYSNALSVWQKAAKNGDKRAQFHLGYMYEKGFGISADFIKAAKLYHLAANQGLPEAQNNLALMKIKGMRQIYAKIEISDRESHTAALPDKNRK